MMGTAIVAGVSGMLTWSFLEYMLHRFVFHGRPFRGTPASAEHTRHHIEGNYFAPTWKKALAAIFATALVLPAAVAVSNTVVGGSYVAGFMLFYVAYEVFHRRLHTHAGFGFYGRWARHHHFHHHFVDARMNHGVTSPLWDIVFGTYQRATTIKVPARLCMPWLVNPRTGSVIDTYASTFRIGGSPQA